MRLSVSPVVPERATGADSTPATAIQPAISRDTTRFLLNVRKARELAHADPASAARQLSDWIGHDG